MKKMFLVATLSLISLCSFAQMTEYTASNNVTYHIGDTITLGRGSAPNGSFLYIQMGDTYSALSVIGGNGQVDVGLPKSWSGKNMIIKKIKEAKFKGSKVVSFSVAGGNIVLYKVLVEDALSTGELKSSGYSSDDALAELKKAKDKLDLGLIKQADFDSLKVKLAKFIK